MTGRGEEDTVLFKDGGLVVGFAIGTREARQADVMCAHEKNSTVLGKCNARVSKRRALVSFESYQLFDHTASVLFRWRLITLPGNGVKSTDAVPAIEPATLCCRGCPSV